MNNESYLENFFYSETHLPENFFQRIIELENIHLFGELNKLVLTELAFMYKVN